MKLILHFGAHKTASTHLQYNLTLNKEVLANHGIMYSKFQELPLLHLHVRQLRCNTRNKEYDLQKAKNVIREEIDKAIKGYDVSILSFEGILGPLDHAKHTDLYPYAEDVIDVYRDILQDYEVIPVFATREYNSFLNSTYKWEVKFNPNYFNLSLNEYLANKKLTTRRWTEIIKKLDNTFNGSTYFFAYEDYKAYSAIILYELIKLTGKSIDYKEVIQDTSEKNVSENPASIDFYYTLNYYFKNSRNFRLKNRFYSFIKKRSNQFSKKTWIKKRLKSHNSGTIPKVSDVDEYKKETEYLYNNYGLFVKK